MLFEECHLTYYRNACNVTEVWCSNNQRFESMAGQGCPQAFLFSQAKLLNTQGME